MFLELSVARARSNSVPPEKCSRTYPRFDRPKNFLDLSALISARRHTSSPKNFLDLSSCHRSAVEKCSWTYSGVRGESSTWCNDRRCANSGSTSNGAVRCGVSAISSIRSCEPLPRKRAARSRCQTRLGSSPINRAQMKSAATGSSARTILPRCRWVPWSGPFPSMATRRPR